MIIINIMTRIIGCCLGILLSFAATGQYVLEKLNDEINTHLDEIAPVVSKDGSTLYFTRVGADNFNKTLINYDHDVSSTLTNEEYFALLKDIYSQIAEKRIDHPAQSGFNQDIWVAKSEDHLFDLVEHPGFPLNNALPNSICGLSDLNDDLLVINQFGKDGSLYHGFSKVKVESSLNYSFPEPIYIYDFFTYSSDVSACMSHDGDVVILSLKRKDSQGGHDLYISYKVKNEVWSSPVPLSMRLNSSYQEISPFLARDKKRLFFASDRDGSGQMDIYVSRRIDVHWDKWTKPRKMFSPINTDADESHPYYDELNDEFYFTSNRDGSSDIFRVNLSPDKDKPVALQFRGVIKDRSTQQPIAANLNYYFTGTDRKNLFYRTNSGYFELKVKTHSTIVFHPEKTGYQSSSLVINPQEYSQTTDSIFFLEFFLDPIHEEKKIALDKIYFVKSKPIVLSKSYPELNRLVKIMSKNPLLKIRIDGHTDNVGDESALLQLSEQRALAIKEYLTDQGIEPRRIRIRGWGAQKPLNQNKNEDEKQANRRVEIIIVENDTQ